MIRGIAWIAAVALAAPAVLFAGSIATAAPPPLAPAAKPSPLFVQFPACTSPTQLDCVESIDLMQRGGSVVKGTVSSVGDRVPIERAEPGSDEWGFLPGTDGYYQTDTWRIRGLRQEYGTEFIRPLIQLATPGVKVNEGGQVFTWPSGLKIELVPGTSPDSQDDGDMEVACPPRTRPCTKIPSFSADQRIRVIVRTSWLRPAYANTTLRDFTVSITPLPRGGSRIVTSGVPLPTPGFFDFMDIDDAGEPREEFDYEQRSWLVDFIDAGDPDFPRDCISDSFPIISSNAWSNSEPYWDAGANQLKFFISAPHRDHNGRLFRGYYDAAMPGEVASCLWAKNPKRLGNLLQIEVLEEDGETQAATTSTSFRRGVLRLSARNFHFSSPTIIVKPKSAR